MSPHLTGCGASGGMMFLYETVCQERPHAFSCLQSGTSHYPPALVLAKLSLRPELPVPMTSLRFLSSPAGFCRVNGGITCCSVGTGWSAAAWQGHQCLLLDCCFAPGAHHIGTTCCDPYHQPLQLPFASSFSQHSPMGSEEGPTPVPDCGSLFSVGFVPLATV